MFILLMSLIQSDHGMATTSYTRLVYLDQFLDLGLFDHIDCWPLKGLHPSPAVNISDIYDYLKPLSDGQPWNVYLRDVDMPPRWHFNSSYRIAPLYLVPDPGWVLLNSKAEFDPAEDFEYSPKGIHGYDNDNELMRSVFLAQGPAFNYNYSVAPFENVEVYGIMTNILGIKENPNNGTFVRGRLQKVSSAVTTIPSSGNEPENKEEESVDQPAGSETGGIPDMTDEDWKEIEEDLKEAEEEDRPLTWKEYLEWKAEEMKDEIASWWDWIKHGGSGERR
jgi:Type I phosphodiesterase / nucleotide pyrophosphatase